MTAAVAMDQAVSKAIWPDPEQIHEISDMVSRKTGINTGSYKGIKL